MSDGKKPTELLRLLLQTDVYSAEEKMEKIEILKKHIDRESFDAMIIEWGEATDNVEFAQQIIYGSLKDQAISDAGSTATLDPNVCHVGCGRKATSTLIVDGDKYRLCDEDSVAWTRTLVSVQSMPTKERPK